MNSISIIGRATDKPSYQLVGPTNRPLAEFTLAYDDFNVKPDPSTGKRPTYFFRVTLWGTKAEHAAGQIVKGQRIGITGRLTQETFTPKGTSTSVTKTRILAESYDLLEKPSTTPSQSSHPSQTTYPPQPSDLHDEIPF